MTDELEAQAHELADLPEPPVIEGAPEWHTASDRWRYELERERRLGEIRRRAVYEEERQKMLELVLESQAIAAQMRDVGMQLSHRMAGLSADLHQLRADVASVSAKVSGHGDGLAKLNERVHELEDNVRRLRLDVDRLTAAERPTLPPEPVGLTDPSEPGGESDL